MKYLLNGIAIAAALAIAAPALAQAPASGAPPGGATAAPAGSPATGHARTARPHRPTHAHHKAASERMARYSAETTGASPSDNVANQLNGQELQRLETGSAPAAMPMPPRPVARPQPGLSTSSGTYIPPSPRGPVSNASPADEGPKTSGGGYITAPTGAMPMPPPPPTAVRPSGH